MVWLAFDSGLPVGRIGAGGCRIEVRARAIEDGCTATGRRAGVERVQSAAPGLEAVVTLVDNAVYVNGQRTAHPQSLEIRSVATEFELPELPVQDAISAHQRPPHRAGTTRSRPVRYLPGSCCVGVGASARRQEQRWPAHSSGMTT